MRRTYGDAPDRKQWGGLCNYTDHDREITAVMPWQRCSMITSLELVDLLLGHLMTFLTLTLLFFLFFFQYPPSHFWPFFIAISCEFWPLAIFLQFFLFSPSSSFTKTYLFSPLFFFFHLISMSVSIHTLFCYTNAVAVFTAQNRAWGLRPANRPRAALTARIHRNNLIHAACLSKTH